MDRSNFDCANLFIKQNLKECMEQVLEDHYSLVLNEFLAPTCDIRINIRKIVWTLCKHLSIHKNGIPAQACYIMQKYLKVYIHQRSHLTPGSDLWNAEISFIAHRSNLFISVAVALAAKMEGEEFFTSYDPVISFLPDMGRYTYDDIVQFEREILCTVGFQLPLWNTLDIAFVIAMSLELPIAWNDIISYTLDIAEYNRTQISADLKIPMYGLVVHGAQKLWKLHLAAAAVFVTIKRHCIHYNDLLNRMVILVDTSEEVIVYISNLIIKHFKNKP